MHDPHHDPALPLPDPNTQDTARLLDFETTLRHILQRNRFAQAAGFHFCTASGIASLEGLLNNYRQHSAFLVLDQITDATTYRRSGTWFQRRIYTIIILQRFRTADMQSYHQALATCRTLYHQLLSYFIEVVATQNTDLAYLDLNNVRYCELGEHFLPATTGLHFHLPADEILDLSYHPHQWNPT